MPNSVPATVAIPTAIQRDLQRNSRPDHQAAEDIAAKIVGPHQMSRIGRGKAGGKIHFGWGQKGPRSVPQPPTKINSVTMVMPNIPVRMADHAMQHVNPEIGRLAGV